jgi:hypothetical protein
MEQDEEIQDVEILDADIKVVTIGTTTLLIINTELPKMVHLGTFINQNAKNQQMVTCVPGVARRMQGTLSNGTWNSQENGQQQPNAYFQNNNNIPTDSRGASMLGRAPVQAVVTNL